MDDGESLPPVRATMLACAPGWGEPILLRVVGRRSTTLARAPNGSRAPIRAGHARTKICLLWTELVGLLSSFGTRPARSITVAAGPMLHLWTVDLPGEPFELEPDEADVEWWLADQCP